MRVFVTARVYSGVVRVQVSRFGSRGFSFGSNEIVWLPVRDWFETHQFWFGQKRSRGRRFGSTGQAGQTGRTVRSTQRVKPGQLS
ncbi:hypothetical protein Hanom_Chr02g00144651 [Helianthus anomalus]